MTQTTKYASVLAKIGAERSKLIDEAKLKALAESKSLVEFAAQLRDTSYQEEIAKLSLPLTSRKLERAFNQNLIETYIKIIKYSPKRTGKYLKLYLLRFENENLKALMKATTTKLAPEQKGAKVYFSVEDYFKRRVIIEEAIKASTPAQMIHALKGTEYFLPMSLGLKNYEENASTASFDVFMDRSFYEELYQGYMSLAKKDQVHANFYASIENDSFALLTLLRGKALNYEANYLRLLIPQNFINLNESMVEALVSSIDFESALKIVLEGPYAKFFVKAQTSAETIAAAEKIFKKAVFQHAKLSTISEIFNIGAPLAFLTQKEAEVHNLANISIGLDFGMKPDDMRSLFLL